MERQKIESSSNIVSVGYDPATDAMEIEFEQGRDEPKVYRYTALPSAMPGLIGELHKGLMTAESRGRYFAAHIRHNKGVQCERVREAVAA